MTRSHGVQFNPADKSNSIIADIDFLLFGTSSIFNESYTLIDRTRNVNISLDEAIAELYKADPNWNWDDTTNTDFPLAYTDLAQAQDHYTLLDETLVVHRFRIKDAQGNWITLEPVLRDELSDSQLIATGTPSRFYKLGGALFPNPIPNYGITNGVELEFQRGGNHFTIDSQNTSPGFNSQYHSFLSVGASHRYAIANGMREKAVFLSNEKERIKTSMREHYQTRSSDEKPKFSLKRGNVHRYGL